MSASVEHVRGTIRLAQEVALRVERLGFTIRQAIIKDIPLLEQIAHEQQWPTEYLRSQINDPEERKRVLLIADKQNLPIAYIYYSLNELFSIHQVAVIHAHQKTSLGLLLAHSAFSNASFWGIKKFSYAIEVEGAEFYHEMDNIKLQLPLGFPPRKVWFGYSAQKKAQLLADFKEEEDAPLIQVSGFVENILKQLILKLPPIPLKEAEKHSASLEERSFEIKTLT